jgi:hypothetical protein
MVPQNHEDEKNSSGFSGYQPAEEHEGSPPATSSVVKNRCMVIVTITNGDRADPDSFVDPVKYPGIAA